MTDQLVQLGVSGFAVIAVLQTVQIFLPYMKNGKNGHMEKQVDELHHWHKREDEDGVKIWYVPRSLESSIEKLATNVDKQTEVLDGLNKRFDELKS